MAKFILCRFRAEEFICFAYDFLTLWLLDSLILCIRLAGARLAPYFFIMTISSNKSKVFVATYTNEGLKFQLVLGPLKFEPSKRGRKPVLPVATI
ncbi:MAG: hypothetical protein COZ49_03255 [Candidatus Yonathbacteria bacterium CG_4_10_14_3_um_filter_47_65]|uniref:Uncharacterized protein n=2 Tax=Parcubacteria group TaxID=1794811 RepID=A0A2M8D5U4_9BACT|nr:MAG: hypothetical protein AUJ44_02055 [Candidatus Nomurabacteria bacterium CG1_02_47_685]PIP03246.1 MAG: hypothetical protein COX54_04365 [Candidatus Yonathbacteria bacterium CG23_combo_of_CG06-09_8_20_14_all_46_18]PIQ32134.1 MAG: hypothetical protein COW61_02245 [Candidatus Yonathbacteria bacterium CG17_big_fil_post_rev_8_21_14_2_50_46_19]PIX56199.1 MAG: hypothetical protein COZ49_03255 [Candidatus Yonathbacteria bacterium CG_4_10_14_3_um_filter_47_65]PIY57737.1 MAG: hypothetical protein CO